MHDFKGLRVWVNAMDMVEQVYRLLNAMPISEQYGLSSQMQRCAVSIPSNIAEGSGRYSAKEFRRFLGIAYGSCNELETQLLLSTRLDYLQKVKVDPIIRQLDELRQMIYRLRKSLE